MKFCGMLVILVCASLLAGSRGSAVVNAAMQTQKQGTNANPVAKVIELLSNLQAKVIAEGEAEQKLYREFAEWCEDESKQKQFEVKTLEAEKEGLEATIEKSSADISAADASIGDLTSGIATNEADLKAATEIRTKENADFAAAEADLVETVDILQRTIGILEREMQKTGSALLQTTLVSFQNLQQALSTIVDATSISFSSGEQAKLTALIQAKAAAEDEDKDLDAAMGAPDPAAYKGHSRGIIDVLEDLLDKAENELADARKKETNARHNYELLKQSIEDEVKNQNKNLAATKAAKAEAQETKATAEGDLATTTADLKETKAYLAQIHQDCMEKAQAFEAATKSRDEELKALAEAKKIIAEATTGGTEVVYDASSFLQLGRTTKSALHTGADLANFEVVKMVEKLAQEHHSSALAQLASRIRATVRYGAVQGQDPFAKVKGLIKDMIERLLNEAQAEANHKAYCDEEMAETQNKKGDLEETMGKLSTKIDKMTSQIAQLKEDVASLQNELAQLAKAQAEMDALRQKEHEQYLSDTKEIEEGIEGLQMALKILRDYYAADGDAHGKASGAGAGIIGLLEVCEADFSKSLADANSTEDSSQAEYDRITKDNEIAKATKESDVKYKTKEYKGLEKALADAQSDLAGTQNEHDAVMAYFAQLKKQCIAKPMPYEERKRRREAEIAGLKEALQILAGEAVLLQKEGKSVTRHAHFLAGRQ